MSSEAKTGEVERLEHLWAGDFGNSYVDRNAHAGDQREPFWRSFMAKYPVKTVLEVGCNIGSNLRWLAKHGEPRNVYGIDINEKALEKIRAELPTVSAAWSPARTVPFRDSWFDLVFTAGVLIHQPDLTLPLVMSEIVRCSRRYVLALEYFAEERTEVPYRGEAGALIKRNYGTLYQASHPELRLVESGFLSRAEGWDDVTWWLFQKTGSAL